MAPAVGRASDEHPAYGQAPVRVEASEVRKMGLLALVGLLSVGCGPAPEEVARGPERTATIKASCNHFGYCYTCSPGISSFKLECNFKMSHFCHGTQEAEARVQDVTYRRGEETYTRAETLAVVRRTGACR